MKTLLSVTLLALLAGLMAAKVLAQRSTGTISGRVIAEDGQPIPHAKISILGIGGWPKMISGRLEILTDERGEFQADKLDAAPYSIRRTPGYVVMRKRDWQCTRGWLIEIRAPRRFGNDRNDSRWCDYRPRD